MNEEAPTPDESRNNRRPADLRPRAPRAARAARFRKKTTSFDGRHRRRNKHWNW